jgi:hypothetical protein
MAINLVKGRHAPECPCRICEIARETIEASRWQEAPEQPNPEAIKQVFAKNGIEPVRKRGQLNTDFFELMDLLRK